MNVVIIVLVEEVRCIEAIKAIALLCYFGGELDKGVINDLLVLRDNVCTFIWKLCIGSI